MDFTRKWRDATELTHERIAARTVDRAAHPEQYKRYEGRPVVTLPAPASLPATGQDLWRTLHGRRSMRRYAETPLTQEALALLCWACQGVTAEMGPYLLRPAPSAGALYPFETYLFLHRAEGLAPGLYHFDVRSFSLTLLREGDLGPYLAQAALGQKFLERAPAVFAWTAVPERAVWKYGDRASRYICMDLGHVCQNLCLAATSLGLGSCAVGAFLDEELNQLMELDGVTEYGLYLASVGHPPS